MSWIKISPEAGASHGRQVDSDFRKSIQEHTQFANRRHMEQTNVKQTSWPVTLRTLGWPPTTNTLGAAQRWHVLRNPPFVKDLLN